MLSPLIFFMSAKYADILPHFPGSPVPIIRLRAGEMSVHIAGILAFMMLNFVKINTIWFAIPWIIVLFFGYSRAGINAILFSFALISLLRFSASKFFRIIALLTIVFIFLSIFYPSLVEFRIKRFASTFSKGISSERDENTKEWRISWWKDIINDTFYGKYFWTGKGFGINLADEYGFQVGGVKDGTGGLRSPHNIFMTVLGRVGVPGFLLWILLHITWGCDIMRHYFMSKRKGDTTWSKVFLFLFAYWGASLINASFDVYLEGPQGGIWFWTIFGVGFASMYIYRNVPQILEASIHIGNNN